MAQEDNRRGRSARADAALHACYARAYKGSGLSKFQSHVLEPVGAAYFARGGETCFGREVRAEPVEIRIKGQYGRIEKSELDESIVAESPSTQTHAFMSLNPRGGWSLISVRRNSRVGSNANQGR